MSELQERQAWAEVEAALRTAPVTHAPATLAPVVMARVGALAQAARPRFTLTWLDVALPLFATLMLAVVYVAWINTPLSLIALTALQTQLYGQRLWQQSVVIAPALAFSLGLALAAVFGAALLFRESRLAVRD